MLINRVLAYTLFILIVGCGDAIIIENVETKGFHEPSKEKDS